MDCKENFTEIDPGRLVLESSVLAKVNVDTPGDKSFVKYEQSQGD